MTEAEAEWWLFLLPIAVTPAILTLTLFYIFVIPRWFKFLEVNNGNHE